jgi:hypothetical protein
MIFSWREMNMENEGKGLSEILNDHFDWNKARMSCFVEMLMALIQMRTVNLVKLACAFNSTAKIDSRYKRIQRFFRVFTIDMGIVAGWVMDVFGLDKVYLSMDRTNWQWGKTDINILMLSVVYKGIAFPVLWSLLDKAGNSNTAERIILIQRFVNRFGKVRIAGVLGDREFIGNDWFAWLRKESIPFCMRIKKNMLTTNSRGAIVYAEELFRDLQVGQQRVLPHARKLWEQTVYLSALRLTDGELLIVATVTLMADPIAHYGKRWEIETLFGCLKSKGFHFEDTHIVNPARINKLLVLLSVAFCWAHKVGEWRHDQKPIKIKKHGRKSQSLFRYGLDYLTDVLINKNSNNQHVLPDLVALLSGRPICTEKL